MTSQDAMRAKLENIERRLQHLETLEEHVALIGLRDNAGAAIDPADDHRIQVTDDGIINADVGAGGDTLDLSFDAASSGLIPWGGVRCQDLIPPLGDFGICNGQFDCGPTTEYPIAMQWVDESGVGVSRIAAGAAGAYCLSLAGGAVPATVRHDWYIPVYESRHYYIACHAYGKVAADVLKFGAHCYNAAGAFLATVWAYNAAPGATWRAIQRRIGPSGDVAFPANTRYIRVVAQAPNAGETIYLDDVQFQQSKLSYSPQIHLVHDYIGFFGGQVVNSRIPVWTLIAGSAMTLTLEEPGYCWIWYHAVARTNAVVRGAHWAAGVYVDGAQVGQLAQFGSWNPTVDVTFPLSERSGLLAAGNHTVDLRMGVFNAGDTVTLYYVSGFTFYTRAY